jgi:hypothetical protein
VFFAFFAVKLGGQEKAVPACLFSNPVEFDGINYGEFARIKAGLLPIHVHPWLKKRFRVFRVFRGSNPCPVFVLSAFFAVSTPHPACATAWS